MQIIIKVKYHLITQHFVGNFFIVRAFMKFDGHLIKNGVKLCASSVAKLHKHEFGP